ncbi:hypothetical protein F383_36050 [Gossypium arboreum]|uniref:Uncharacterized protein n=1 Tax=Gossypium arboreum TaxID=29729 RepID=A0A0B0N827_GOSAR|nr:hypothetical protein F383_36050 [Gossypium arboreum]
MFPYFAVQQT